MINKRKRKSWAYLDRKLIVLHGWVNEENKRLREETFVFGFANESLIVLEQLNSIVVDGSSRVVKADQTFFGVDFALKFEHLLRVVLIDHQDLATAFLLSLFNFERHRKARLHINFRAVNAAKERSDDRILTFGPAQVMVENVGHDGGVDVAVEGPRVNAKVQVRQVGLLRNLRQFCLVYTLIRLHKCFFTFFPCMLCSLLV